MKDPNGFDELARRKLAEREFPFDAEHWTGMERLMAERGRKPKAWWSWMAAGVLLLVGGVMWSVTGEETASMQSKDGEVAEQMESSTTTSETTATVQIFSSTQGSPPADGQLEQSEGTPLEEAKTEVVNAPRTQASSARRTAVARPRAEAATPAVARDAATQVPPSTTIDQVNVQPAMVTLAEGAQPDGPPAFNNPEPISDPPGPVDDPAVDIALTAAATEVPAASTPDIATMAAPKTDPDNTAVPEPVQQPLEPANGTNTSTPEPSASGTEPPAPGVVGPSVVPPAPAEWLASRTSFELSLLGGAFSTTGDYRGSDTETWKASTERQNTLGFGIEGIWNVGPHSGLGLGAHYSSYKERLTTSELSRTDEVLSNSYFWVQHDTMVLTVVGDTTIGATTYNITELVPITINELGMDTDTTYNTTVLRDRRTVTNTVNYVEIPLLLDAHTSCGRWVFGVRGGPTFGLLTSKQGTIPGEGEMGYADLSERTFRSMTLGATARAYVRYRLTSAWAIGLEPTWRQQIGNAFGDAEVQRRGNAFGGYLSLSYRFAPKSVVP